MPDSLGIYLVLFVVFGAPVLVPLVGWMLRHDPPPPPPDEVLRERRAAVDPYPAPAADRPMPPSVLRWYDTPQPPPPMHPAGNDPADAEPLAAPQPPAHPEHQDGPEWAEVNVKPAAQRWDPTNDDTVRFGRHRVFGDAA